MRIALSNSSINLNRNVISRLVTEEDRDKATVLGLWDKFKDFFRTEKKADVLNELFNLIHKDEDYGISGSIRLSRFEKIKNIADPVYQELFTTQITEIKPNERKYTLMINRAPIYDFLVPSDWDELSKLKSGDKSLIENYGDIVKEYAQSQAEDFKKEYPGTNIKNNYGADEMMDYSSYFLHNNPEIKNKLLEFGITNNDVYDNLLAGFRTLEASGQLSEEMRGKSEYMLMTLAGTLKILDNFDSQPEQ